MRWLLLILLVFGGCASDRAKVVVGFRDNGRVDVSVEVDLVR